MKKQASYLAEPQHPFREMLQALTGKKPPNFVRGYNTDDYSDAENTALLDWAAFNCRPFWGTGIGLVEAAEKMVDEAVINANIPPKETK